MKKSSFVALVMGTIGGVFAALGMCMCLLPDWNAFRPGVIMGCVGLAMLLLMVIVWRRMTNKDPIRISGKTLLAILLGIIGALMLGVGMCFTMVWGQMLLGIILGLAGIILLIFLIPLVRGLK